MKTEATPTVEMIPVNQIDVVSLRARNKKGRACHRRLAQSRFRMCGYGCAYAYAYCNHTL
jgi:hypothetical protein